MPFKPDYDVFLSHNSKDKSFVEVLAGKLTEAGLQVFLDKWSLVPGEPWQDEIEEALLRSASCAICIGQDSRGPWAHEEMRAALSLAVEKRSVRVIPVLLPDASQEVLKSLPLFLRNRTWVDLSDGIEDEEGIKRLISGIFGRRPREFSTSTPNYFEARLEPRISQALPQATDYQDRKELTAFREYWADETRRGVLALVGIGGSGKTALVSRFLQELPSSGVSHDSVSKRSELPIASALFVWSFYDFPDVDQFFTNLFSYLLPDEDLNGNTADKALKLVQALEITPYPRVLIVLDGLEVVQEGKESEQLFGLLRDSSLRHLLRRLSQGIKGVKTIITTRFPIPDLLTYKSSGYMQLDTDELDLGAACQLLLSRGVHGTKREIQDLVQQFGSHALTLDHLGVVLRDFFDGDAKKSKSLAPLEAMSSDARSDYQAYRLANLFSFYQQRLPSRELELLKSLCIFRLPVEMDVLVKVFSSQEKKVGKRVQKSEALTNKAILSLKTRRLVTIRSEGSKRWCNVHPSIREFFYASLGKAAGKIHAQAVKVFMSLTERPRGQRERADPEEIDAIGELIYHSLRSGDTRGAIEYYADLICGYEHLGWKLAAFEKGYRISGYFKDIVDWSELPRIMKYILNDHALFMLDLGRTTEAQSLLEHVIEINDGPNKGYPDFGRAYQFILKSNLCDALTVTGKLLEAEKLADVVCDPSHDKDYHWRYDRNWRAVRFGFNPFARRAIVRSLRGNIDGALSDFKEAISFNASNLIYTRRMKESEVTGFTGRSGVEYAMLLAHIGELPKANSVLQQSKNCCLSDPRSTSKAAWLLGRAEFLRIIGQIKQAVLFVEQSLAWSIETSHQELYCKSQLLVAKLCLIQGNVAGAEEAVAESCRIAAECSLGIQITDSGVLSGWVSFQRGNLTEALAKAREASDRAMDRCCDYGWGIADSAYLEGKCLLAEGKKADAIKKFECSAEYRRKLRDPRLMHVERLLTVAKQ